jgi:hypothetical protein
MLKPLQVTLALALVVGAFLFPTLAFGEVANADKTAPTLTASLSDDTLTVEAIDGESGIEAVYIDGHRINTLVDGRASVALKDYVGNAEKVTIYALDRQGNRSQPVLLENPYYKAPARLAGPSAATVQTLTAQTAASSASAPSAPTSSPATAEPTSEPQNPTSNSSEDNSPVSSIASAFTPDGTASVMDNATGEDGKEFFTITATDGSVYYLVIDKQRGQQDVYFLSAVTTDDLLPLTEGSSVQAPSDTYDPSATVPPTEQTESAEIEQTDEDRPDRGTVPVGVFILIAAVIAAGIGSYFKIIKPRREQRELYESEDHFFNDDEDSFFNQSPPIDDDLLDLEPDDYFFEEDRKDE